MILELISSILNNKEFFNSERIQSFYLIIVSANQG